MIETSRLNNPKHGHFFARFLSRAEVLWVRIIKFFFFFLTDRLVEFFLFFSIADILSGKFAFHYFSSVCCHAGVNTYSVNYERVQRKCKCMTIWEFLLYKCVRYLLNNTGTCAFSGLCSHEKRSLTVKTNLRFERKYLIHLANKQSLACSS